MKDFILHKRRALSKDKCDSIINYFETHKESHYKGTAGGRGVDPHVKISTEILFSFRSSMVGFIFNDSLKEALNAYKKQYPFVDEGCNGWTVDDAFKIQKYNPNEGYFSLHCENGGNPDFIRRVLAWMIYLNDVTAGGYTEFPTQRKKFQPRRGDVLIWPAYWTHPHRGIVSKSQTKYILTGWYSFR